MHKNSCRQCPRVIDAEQSAANSMLPCEPVVEVHGHGVVPSSSQEVRS